VSSRYDAIANDSERLQRTARNSIRTLAELYADRTHFILELLQNAEDALRRRGKGWDGPRSAKFVLSEDSLSLVHFGLPFDESDVQAICSVGETTKKITDIGRFGIGFKSVYAFTERPEIHSGAEDFAIQDFIQPLEIAPIKHDSDATVIIIRRKPSDSTFRSEIESGLKRLGMGTLLFLREIKAIEWTVENGASGSYRRTSAKALGDGVRLVSLIGQIHGQPDETESWLLFSRPVATPDGKHNGFVEVAFSVSADEEEYRISEIHPLSRSPLVVFFPTALETCLGFLVQGPYRTTPSRDNVPNREPWNQLCVAETANAVIAAMRWLRDHELLSPEALCCLPLHKAKFPPGAMFAPVFDAIKQAFLSEDLLPCSDGSYAAAPRLRLARTDELRGLLDRTQLATLFGIKGELAWLTGTISQVRTSELRDYLMRELNIAEITPETMVAVLNASFLTAQTNAWIQRLYGFLSVQQALRARVSLLPIVRLQDGRHVRPTLGDQPQAFLPGSSDTGFPLVHPEVCGTEAAKAFLRSLGLSEPDPVDDVVRNVLPKYDAGIDDFNPTAYAADIKRIVAAFATDSKSQREKLTAELSGVPFVMAVDSGNGSKGLKLASATYQPTEKLKELFAGISGVKIVDIEQECLRGEGVRQLLDACGAGRNLHPISVSWSIPEEKRREIRRAAGLESATWEIPINDFGLLGLAEFIKGLAKFTSEEKSNKARLLWEALCDLEARRGSSLFSLAYSWSYSRNRRTVLVEPAFVRLLNENEWVPDVDGILHRPATIAFENLEWKNNPLLLAKIQFMPTAIDQLAGAAKFEPAALALLKSMGITTEAAVRKLMGIAMETAKPPAEHDQSLTRIPPKTQSSDSSDSKNNGISGSQSAPDPNGQQNGVLNEAKNIEGAGGSSNNDNANPVKTSGRKFVSYVAADPNDSESDPEGLDYQTRMSLEAKAIDLILSVEPHWKRTPPSNPGFDLVVLDDAGLQVQWCEVKSMTGSLFDRPVGISRTQFDYARIKGSNYWLYVVEHTGTPDAHIVRIQDPAGKAATFTFDRGWLAVAEPESHSATPASASPPAVSGAPDTGESTR
jgi:hypothetical protein